MTQGGCPHVRNSNHRPIKVGVSQCYNGGLYLPNETCSLQYPVRRATFPLSVSPPPSSALPRSFPPSGGLFRRNITLQMAARLLISPSQSRPRLQRGRAGERGRRERATAFNAFNYSFQQFAPFTTHSLQLGARRNSNCFSKKQNALPGENTRRTDMRTAHDWRTKISLRQHQFAMQLCLVSFALGLSITYQLTVKYLLKLVTADQLSMISTKISPSASDHKRLDMTKT